jgi:pimeloyl-ACP methyl ester carboxylesterase
MKHQTTYKRTEIDGVGIFYREAGDPKNPTLLLLHGFPTSSHQYRNLIPALADEYHVIAPDYPGFGHSDMPDRKAFNYTFDNFAAIIEKLLAQLKINDFAMYVFDYGAPVGFRLYQENPDRVTAIITQNGNAYDEGIAGFWDPIKAYWNANAETEREAIRWLTSLKATKWQYENGTPENRMHLLGPDGWQHDQSLMDRPGNSDIQLDIFYDYRTNIPLYPKWQALFREKQTPTLAVWGKNDQIFVAPGGNAFKRDLENAEIHMLDAGHFVLETHLAEVINLIKPFLSKALAARLERAA